MKSGAGLAVVTGASRGIGRSAVNAFARRGIAVALLGRESAELSAATAEARSHGVEAASFACDVAIEADVERAGRAVLESMGVPTIVVNNAGIVRRDGPVEETPVASWDEVIAVNLRGPFLVSRAFVPAMKAAGRGRLVFVASISSTIGCPGTASYAASKWGVLGLAKSLAEEVRGSGLVVTSVLPGSVDTRMLEGSGFEPKMTPDDVANTIVYLALDAPPATHGASIEVFG